MTAIVHVTAPAAFGGLERVVSGLAVEQVSRGHRVAVCMTLSPNAEVPFWARSLERSGVSVHAIHIDKRGYLAERRIVRRVIEQHGAEVVHTHGYRSDVLIRGVARSLALPIVSTAHGFGSAGRKRTLNERLQLHFWKGFDAIAVVSNPLRETLQTAGVAANRIVLIRNGIVPSPGLRTRHEARQLLGLPAEGPVIGWVGRMSEEKAPLLAVEAFAQVASPQAQLHMIGDGPLRAAILERAAALGVGGRVRADGSRGDAAELLSAFDMLLLSSHTEGTPMVILEAAMAGVPIVSTAVGGVPDVVGADALTVPARDANALARAMDTTLGDAAAATQRAERLRTRLNASAAADDWVGQYLALYDRVRRENPKQR